MIQFNFMFIYYAQFLRLSGNGERWGALAVGDTPKPNIAKLASPTLHHLDALVQELLAIAKSRPTLNASLRKRLFADTRHHTLTAERNVVRILRYDLRGTRRSMTVSAASLLLVRIADGFTQVAPLLNEALRARMAERLRVMLAVLGKTQAENEL